MPLFGYMIKLSLAIWEIMISLQYTRVLVLNTEKMGKVEKISTLIFSIVLGALLAFNRKMSMVSWAMVIFCVITTFLFMGITLRQQWTMIFAITWSYYSLVGILNVFFAFIAFLILRDDFNELIYMNYTSMARDLIYFISCSILSLVLLIIKRMVQKKKINLSIYRYMLWAMGIILYTILWRYHCLLEEVAHGIDEMTNTIALSLGLSILFVGFGAFVVLKYKMIDKEYETLLVQEEMSRKKYDELSEMMEYNARLRHDMRNHLVIIRKYAQEKDTDNIQRYLDSIYREYLSMDYINWTGNDIVDTILNQKRKQASEQKVEFIIDTCAIEILPVEESEICSLLGNMLDNALEAAVQAEKSWIKITIKKQMDMLCFDIRNSYSVEPVLKAGNFISNKKDKGVHGFGTKSIKRIVEKYDGKITFSTHDNQFITQVTFFDVD